jgi:hypothetical protein
MVIYRYFLSYKIILYNQYIPVNYNIRIFNIYIEVFGCKLPGGQISSPWILTVSIPYLKASAECAIVKRFIIIYEYI